MARIATIMLGVGAVILGIVFKGQNVAYMVGLAFAIAASANFPALMLSMFWRRFTTWGAVCSILFGTFGTLLLIYLGPTIQLDMLKNADAPNHWWFFPLKNPCLFTMTGAFIVGIVVSLLKPEPSSEEGFAEMERRATSRDHKARASRVIGRRTPRSLLRTNA